MSYSHHPLASKITNQVNDLRESGEFLELVTPTTADLLRYWFDEAYMDMRGTLNFHEGQRQAILNTVYCHEILKVEHVSDMYNKVHSTLDLEEGVIEDIMDTKRYSFPRYCMKMATGTGKTWVLNALLIRQLVNAHEGHTWFTKNFLIVAPWLIVYDRLLDSVLGKIDTDGKRIFETSDYYKFSELFIPWQYKDLVFGFVQNNTVPKEEIGRKVVGNGQLLITNRHALSWVEEEEVTEYDPYENPEYIINSILPAKPWVSTGNSLDVLDRKFLKGWVLDYCKKIPDLIVFNDEAHHLWENVSKSAKEEDKKRQQAINEISTGKKLFVQVDFSATPYIEKSPWKAGSKKYFPHIIIDFTIQEAIRKWFVKSLTLDERKELASIKDDDLDFNAERDDDRTVIGLSNGQKIMLQAGLKKLKILEEQFTSIVSDSPKFPKLLVVCEDTNVVPFVEQFLIEQWYAEEEYESIHSNKKWEVTKEQRDEIKYKIFSIDKHKNPKVIISVLMLREGFDVNNICVIVPLRSASSSVLLEQTIGRGLRLMRREHEDMRMENLKLLQQKKEPSSYVDILTIIEHPKFKQFYESLIEDWLVSIDDSSDDEISKKALWDLINIELKSDYQYYDLFLPYVISDIEENLKAPNYTLDALQPISQSFQRWKSKVGTKESFRGIDVLSKTRYWDYDVEYGIMSAKNFNDYISKLVNRIANHTSYDTSSLNAKWFGEHWKSHYPITAINLWLLTNIVISYIENKLFNEPVDYFQDSNRRVLMVEEVTEFIIKQIINMIIGQQQSEIIWEAMSLPIYLSNISTLLIREDYAIDVQKCIYPKLQYPSNKGDTERDFILFLDNDSLVESFCKIYEQKHTSFKFRYVREDGIPANYFPDFIVKTSKKIYIVEIKAKKDLSNENVIRKKKSAVAYMKRINSLSADQRDFRMWEYIILSDTQFYQLQNNGANIIEMFESTKLSEIKESLF